MFTYSMLKNLVFLSLLFVFPGKPPVKKATTANPKWVQMFNGKDLTDWHPKIRYHDLDDNFKNTFRVENGLLEVRYDQYDNFNETYGHIFYKKPYSYYLIGVEYRFVGEQCKGGAGWAYKNNGIMIHGQPPETMKKDQDFPNSIEVQLLGGSGKGNRPTANVCTPGTQYENDGKIIIVGQFTNYNGTTSNYIARLNTNGNLDTSFHTGTGIKNGTNYSNAVSVVLQSDGKIIVGGYFLTYNGITSNYIARINANGTLDNTFLALPGANTWVKSISMQSDNKIIITGYFTAYNNTNRNYLARLNTNGTLDTSLHIGTGPDNTTDANIIQPDGKIIISGNFLTYNGDSTNGIARLNTNGTLDTTFHCMGSLMCTPYKLTNPR